MSKQLIAILIAIVLLVAGATAWFLRRGSNNLTPMPPSSNKEMGGTSAFPLGNDRARATKDDGGAKTPNGVDIKTGNGFLAERGEVDKNVFREIVSDSVAGAVVIERQKGAGSGSGKASFVRYVESATGHVKELLLGQREATRVANTTVPKIVRAWFEPKGETLALEVLTDPFNIPSTVLARIVSGTTSPEAAGELAGANLPETNTSVALSPSGKTVFTLSNKKDGLGAEAVLQSITGKNRRLLWNSPLREWQVNWTHEEAISLTTKPSVGVPGYFYTLSPLSGIATRILGNLHGLTAKLSSNGARVLYATSNGNLLESIIFDIKTGAKRLVPMFLIPEKCVWSTGKVTDLYCAVPRVLPDPKSFPDAWYRGDISFSDGFWKIDTSALKTIHLGNPPFSVDAVRLTLSPSEDVLLFTNKSDGHLWSLKLNE